LTTTPLKKPLKILYAIQGTGNGHVARAREIIPVLQEFGQVDVVLSGDQSNVELPCAIKYRSKGLTFIYDKGGGVSYMKTLFKNNLFKIFQEIRSFPVQDYDVVINDFEFITAWACKMRKINCIGMGHQASFRSEKTPRPKRRQWLGELILKNYAPCTRAIGFHFDHFDTFIQRPVIRGEIRRAVISNLGHYTVYLPAYGDERIHRYLSQITDKEWQVFSKFTREPYQLDNVCFRPISNSDFIESFTSCEGILTSAGFETPAEAIFMGKKVFVIPIKRQYEQFCNAEAMRSMGLPIAKTLNDQALLQIKDWVKYHKPLSIDYPDTTRQLIADEIFAQLEKEEIILPISRL